MILKRSSDYIVENILLFICLLGATCIFIWGIDLPVWKAFAYLSPAWLLFILTGISRGRTIELSAEGCTVRFLCFHTTYLWNDLKTKRVVNCPRHPLIYNKNDCPYKQCAIFSPLRVHKPKWMRPMVYAWFHPWTFIYLNFAIPDEVRFGQVVRHAGRYYEIDEKLFYDKMKQWYVDIELPEVP